SSTTWTLPRSSSTRPQRASCCAWANTCFPFASSTTRQRSWASSGGLAPLPYSPGIAPRMMGRPNPIRPTTQPDSAPLPLLALAQILPLELSQPGIDLRTGIEVERAALPGPFQLVDGGRQSTEQRELLGRCAM